MKSLNTLLLIAACITTLSAQIQKGSMLIGGTVGFNNLSNDGDGLTTINLSPMAGFFLSDHFVLGAEFDFNAVISDGNTTSTLGLSPFVRYYFNDSGKARFFGQASAGFEVDGGFNGDPVIIFGLAAGVDFFLNDNVAIEAALGYNRFQDPENENGLNNIGLNIGVAAFINRGGDKK